MSAIIVPSVCGAIVMIQSQLTSVRLQRPVPGAGELLRNPRVARRRVDRGVAAPRQGEGRRKPFDGHLAGDPAVGIQRPAERLIVPRVKTDDVPVERHLQQRKTLDVLRRQADCTREIAVRVLRDVDVKVQLHRLDLNAALPMAADGCRVRLRARRDRARRREDEYAEREHRVMCRAHDVLL
jgi:hypothetical protein